MRIEISETEKGKYYIPSSVFFLLFILSLTRLKLAPHMLYLVRIRPGKQNQQEMYIKGFVL